MSRAPALNQSFCLPAIVALGLAGMQPAMAVAPAPVSIDDAIQVLADLTAIDADCHDLSVNFGIGFHYASNLGVAPSTVMPTGSRRATFDKDFALTQDNYGPTIVCGALAHHYSVALPGSVTFSVPVEGGS